ncbi:hypothetical protein H310_09544 [Aphanomyces invadans]|uniref:Annexin n=1 Tax=Aphanomyces invadans TaxID=157072 RepID=A0A024TUE6_9STRA|nr:hypothetical protein H310_09544 [Aphanomyces invadans]ETV97653.1 hypothetical protein H310_09544 [Aphanomyces invadans]RHY26866.1 hypothetical protein DYB32_007218 [Aphanomyces invadans]|eukprot:XP_008873862.1 hypothetical protein H310_09544 [Aphanomyces invadans]
MQVYSQHARDADRGVAINAATPEIDNICHEIKAAVAGFGTDEGRLNRALGARTLAERYLVSVRYPQIHGKSLVDELASETSGDYRRLLLLLAQPLADAEATIIRDATKGAGTNEDLLFPVFGGRTSQEISILKKAFFKKYGQDLVVTVADDVGGDLKKHYLAILNALTQPYDPAVHNQHKAEELAEVIYKAGEGKWGTDETAFINALVSIPPEFLRAVDAAYVAKHKNNLARAIEKEFTGHTERALMYHVNIILNPIETVVDQFERTMKGIGTDEYGLGAAVVRYQSILKEVAPAYKAKYGKSLRDRIHDETGGDFQKLLLIVLEHSI